MLHTSVGLLFICPWLYQSLYPDRQDAPHFFFIVSIQHSWSMDKQAIYKLNNMFDLYELASTWLFVVFCLFWGLSSFVNEWSEFSTKLVNTLVVIGLIVFIIINMCRDFFISGLGIGLGGLAALWLGAVLSDSIDDEWNGVCAVVALLAFIAMFITLACYV